MSVMYRHRHQSPNLRAFSLAETAVSLILVSLVLVAALNTVGYSVTARHTLGDDSRGHLLAVELLTEILSQPYEEPVDVPAFGREAGETGGDRAGYDDVDDYVAWDSAPPTLSDGTAIPNLDTWRRTAKVNWVDANDHTSVVGTDSGVKRIEVTVLRNDKPVATVVGVRTRAGDVAVVDPAP